MPSACLTICLKHFYNEKEFKKKKENKIYQKNKCSSNAKLKYNKLSEVEQ